jgi:hypothetical protein
VQLDVHRVAAGRQRGRHAAPYHPAEAFVGRELPLHHDRTVRHAAEAVLGQRGGRQPGPEHEAVGLRIARGHAESEGIAAQRATVGRRISGERPGRHRGGGTDGGAAEDEISSGECHASQPGGHG